MNIGIDQYGKTYLNLGKYPRKELLKRLGYKGGSIIYRDTKEGIKQIGYCIGGYWITLYNAKVIEK